MFVNEYGLQIQFGVSFDMSANTSLAMHFTKPDGTLLNVTAALGTVQIVTTLGIFAANTYGTYIFQNGDVNQAGQWQVRLIYDDASPAHLISSIGLFEVLP